MKINKMLTDYFFDTMLLRFYAVKSGVFEKKNIIFQHFYDEFCKKKIKFAFIIELNFQKSIFWPTIDKLK